LALHARGFQNGTTPEMSGEKHLLRSLKNQDIKVCLDIGANVGNYSKMLIDILGAEVIAFEPLEAACINLEEMAKIYPKNFYFHKLAISDVNATRQLFFGTPTSEIATLQTSNSELDFVMENNVNSAFIKTVTLDSFFEQETSHVQRIDFIKVDVEGHEFQVLSGAQETIRKFRPRFIQIEYNRYNLFSGINLFQIAKLLVEYSMYQLLPGNSGIRRRDPRDSLSNICEFSNYIFVLNGTFVD
jgi:FkbM family methyltransferase